MDVKILYKDYLVEVLAVLYLLIIQEGKEVDNNSLLKELSTINRKIILGIQLI